MKTEFYFDRRKYSCSIAEVQGVNELRIRNPEGLILAVQQGKTVGLIGKTRKDAKIVSVTEPRLYNLIKAATTAINLTRIDRYLQEKELLLREKDRQIALLNQQLAILQAESDRLSLEKQQELGQLQQDLRDKEQKIQRFEQFITAHRSKLIDLKEVERDLKTKLGEAIWLGLTKATQKEFCNAFRHYCSIKSEEFTALLSDYSTAGTPLGCGVEREVVSPYFKAIRQFYDQNLDKYGTSLTTELNALIAGTKRKYTLGDLPLLLSPEWTTYRREALEAPNRPPSSDLYRSIARHRSLGDRDRDFLQTFLAQWPHPLAQWLRQGEAAASAIDRIGQLRNRAAHADTLYLWQFKELWGLIIGSDRPGILQQIYGC